MKNELITLYSFRSIVDYLIKEVVWLKVKLLFLTVFQVPEKLR